MKLLGALLVVIAGAAVGLSAGESVRRTSCMAESAGQIVRRLQTLVCARRLPLPIAISALREEFPKLILEETELGSDLRARSFGDLWADRLCRMSLPADLERILTPLGRELSGGEEPEQCFERILSELHTYRETCKSREREAVRLYPALGLSGGLILAILFI